MIAEMIIKAKVEHLLEIMERQAKAQEAQVLAIKVQTRAICAQAQLQWAMKLGSADDVALAMVKVARATQEAGQ